VFWAPFYELYQKIMRHLIFYALKQRQQHRRFCKTFNRQNSGLYRSVRIGSSSEVICFIEKLRNIFRKRDSKMKAPFSNFNRWVTGFPSTVELLNQISSSPVYDPVAEMGEYVLFRVRVPTFRVRVRVQPYWDLNTSF